MIFLLLEFLQWLDLLEFLQWLSSSDNLTLNITSDFHCFVVLVLTLNLTSDSDKQTTTVLKHLE